MFVCPIPSIAGFQSCTEINKSYSCRRKWEVYIDVKGSTPSLTNLLGILQLNVHIQSTKKKFEGKYFQ